jgi:hypothetical protein
VKTSVQCVPCFLHYMEKLCLGPGSVCWSEYLEGGRVIGYTRTLFLSY